MPDIGAEIDTTRPHTARRYDYWLGGKDNFAADRASGDAIAEVFPTIRLAVLENRNFLRRATGFLARDAGIRQFLDIGTGIPTANNTHQVAQTVAPEARIVYVDNDPIVLTHARALLTSTPEGATAYLDADLHNPEAILNHPDLRETLDLSQPVALMLVAILHFIIDDDEAYSIVSRLVDALPSGSYLAISHGTQDFMTPGAIAAVNAEAATGRHGPPIRFRSRDQLAPFFAGLDLVPPGLVSVTGWRPEPTASSRPADADIGVYGAIGRLP
jgi:hypothetical protein